MLDYVPWWVWVAGAFVGVLPLVWLDVARRRPSAPRTAPTTAGWHWDPWRPGTGWMRYHDGRRWTESDWFSPVSSPWMD